MSDRFSAAWHKASFDRFLSEHLPRLLVERLPLAGYAVQVEDTHHCRVTVEITTNNHTITVEYPGLPQPDEQGLFSLKGQPYVVIPIASQEELDLATVQCVGEQLHAYLAVRLGQASADMTWDEPVARAFLPLHSWFNDFLSATAQRLDSTNWHSRHTHLRRLLILSRKKVNAPGQQGRVDPFETPEGPNIARVFTIALGAEIQGDKIVITDNRPEAGLGQNSAQIPFLEHDDPNRLLMGVNMMRQALVPPAPEPALVQTGNAPEDAGADFWCGRNLLTAFVAWGEGSTEDGLILSESCAQRFNFPYPAQPGDKIANRHGSKGVVSQVLPDAQMPHLADGTPVEIIFSFTGLHTRMNFGQIREAVMGRIARAEGQPAIVAPFHAPTEEELRARLAASGLPESGMERMRASKDGPEMPYPSTIGWVYWYRLNHLAQDKLRAVSDPVKAYEKNPVEADIAPHPILPPWEEGQAVSDMELAVLRQVGALHNAREALTTRAVRWRRLNTSQLETSQTGTRPSPYFEELAARLAAAGIAMTLENDKLAFSFAHPKGKNILQLAAHRLPHPWLQSGELTTISRVGAPPAEAGPAALRAFHALVQVNDRMIRWLDTNKSKKILVNAAVASTEFEQRQLSYLMGLTDQLAVRLNAYFNTLLPAEALRVIEPQAFSGRAVIAPALGLRLDQVGLPETIIQALFGSAPDDEDMARAWVIVHRSPAVTPTAFLAFHPVRVPDPAIRLHPQACALLNADFDGDQVAVYLPLCEAAQQEAGEKLSIAAHFKRDPQLAAALLPPHEGIWGLASLSLSADGRRQIADTLSTTEDSIGVPVQQADLAAALREMFDLQGPEATLRAANALAQLGYAASSASGASLSPFATSQVRLPDPPVSGDTEVSSAWEDYVEACAEAVLSGRDFTNPNLGPQLLSAAVRPRSRRFLPLLVGPRGPVSDASGRTVIIRHSLVEGRTPEELYAATAGAREGLAKLAFESEEILQQDAHAGGAIGGAITVLARARRARRAGIVFARAAASEEIDPLMDAESRLLVGL